ncbi:MAG: hypothetical protein AAF501_10730 [Pseudomonadota bacterium]
MDVDEATSERVFSLAAFDPAGKPPDVNEWLRFEGAADGHDHHHHHNVNNHGDTATAYCFTATDPIDPHTLDEALRALQVSLGPALCARRGWWN